MTKKEIEVLAAKIADKVFEKLIKITEDYSDHEEQQIVNSIFMNGSPYTVSDEDMLMGELARLHTILMIYEDREEYEKASIVMSKINRIKHKLSKL